MKTKLALFGFLLLVGGVASAQYSMAWWVFYAYRYPRVLIEGPFSNMTDCQQVAQTYNRVTGDFNYHCEYH